MQAIFGGKTHFCFVCEKRKYVIKFGRKVIEFHVGFTEATEANFQRNGTYTLYISIAHSTMPSVESII